MKFVNIRNYKDSFPKTKFYINLKLISKKNLQPPHSRFQVDTELQVVAIRAAHENKIKIIIAVKFPIKTSAVSRRPETSFPHLRGYNFQVHFSISGIYYNSLDIIFPIQIDGSRGFFIFLPPSVLRKCSA